MCAISDNFSTKYSHRADMLCYNRAMKQLQADMKKGIYKKIYLLTGTQDYMKKRAVRSLSSVFVADDDTMNLAYFHGKKVDIKEVIALSDTMPFLAEKRVIILEDTEFFSRSCEELADYIPNIPETTVLIFCEEKIDARLKQTKAVKTHGCIAQFSTLSDAELKNFIIKKLATEHRPITEAALDMFIARCGDDMWQITNDLEKIVSYTFGKDGIRPDDVAALMPPRAEDKIFAMIDSILAGRPSEAMKYYGDLLVLRSDPLGILKLLEDQLRLLYHVKLLDEEHMSLKDMAAALSMRDVRVKMALPAARKSSKIGLTRKIEMCTETDERIKSGLVDKQIGIESLIFELAKNV